MSERYWITGVQLGILTEKTFTGEFQKKVFNDIINNQFIGNYYTDEEKKEFEKKISKLDDKK